MSSSAREADEYVMHAYLGHHYERVRKRKQIEMAEGRPPAETASQRLAALRCRVAIRLNASRRSGSDADTRSTGDLEAVDERASGGGADMVADAASSAAASCVAWHTAETNTRWG